MFYVRQHGTSLMEFFVRSRTNPFVEHAVDVMAYQGNGECTCEHFMFKLGPQLKEGKRHWRKYKCFHILLAETYLLAIAKPRLWQAEHPGKPMPQVKLTTESKPKIKTKPQKLKIYVLKPIA
jgi:hypothetical protein